MTADTTNSEDVEREAMARKLCPCECHADDFEMCMDDDCLDGCVDCTPILAALKAHATNATRRAREDERERVRASIGDTLSSLASDSAIYA